MASPAAPTVSIRTFGCRLNQAETARIKAQLTAAGYRCVDNAASAEICIVHACAVTQTAQREALRTTRALRRLPQTPRVVLAGCLAQAIELPASARRAIDLVVGHTEKWNLPAALASLLGVHRAPADRPDADLCPIPVFEGVRAWLAVQDGCDFGCAYCIVPKARGRPCSRPLATVLAEAHALITAGHTELVLTGANAALYRDGSRDLADLAAAVAELPGLFRLRLGSIEPSTVEHRIIAQILRSPRICRSLHLPLQSGDAGILRAMRRRYTPETFQQTAREALEQIPGLALGTDIITGFPGETETAFQNTVRLVESLPFANLHVFPYSERPGTIAAERSDPVPPPLRKARARHLIRIGEHKRRQFAATFLTRDVEILVERQHPESGWVRGWTAHYLPARIADGHALPPGTAVRARVRAVENDELICAGPEPIELGNGL